MSATLSSVIALATDAGAWIDEAVEAIVRNAAPGGVGKNNKPKPSKCVLQDPKNPNVTLKACWFGGNFGQHDDKVIRISGRSNKVSLYNGTAELSIGKEGIVELVGPAPSQAGAPPTGAPPPGGDQGVDPTAAFHRGMQKIALLYAHCQQYARNVEQVLGHAMPPEHYQACVSSLFITAKDQGALVKGLPKLRAVDDKGVPFRFVPEAADPEAKKRAAEEAAKKAAEEAARRAQQENLDEDVPF